MAVIEVCDICEKRQPTAMESLSDAQILKEMEWWGQNGDKT